MPEETPARQYEDAYLWTPADRLRLRELHEAMHSATITAVQAASSREAASDAPKTMDEDPSTETHAAELVARDAASELDEFITEAKTRARVVRMVALPRKPWRALKESHPIRMVETKTKDAEGVETTAEKPHQLDAVRGFNVETMADDLVAESIEFDGSNAARDAFLDSLSEPDFNSLYAAALNVNTGFFTPPKAEFSLHLDRIIAEILNSPDPSD